MPELMNRALPFIHVLSKSGPKLQKAIFQHGPPDVILALCGIVQNVLKGVIELTPRQKRYLSQYKKQLRALVKKGKKKRNK